MALGTELLGKAIISVKADTAQARAEIAKLSVEEQKAAKARVKAQEEANATMERSAQKYALWATASVAAFAIAGASVKKYEEHLKSLGSGGEAELRKIQTASETLSNAQNELQFAIARVALAAAPAAEALGAMATEIANIVDGIGGVINKVSGLIPGGSGTASFVGKWGGRAMFGAAGIGYGIYSDVTGGSTKQYATSAGFDYNEGNGPGQEEGREVIHPDVARGLGWIFVSGPDGGYWRPPTDAEKAEKEAKAKEHADAARRQAEIYANAWRAIQGDVDATSGNARGDGNLSGRSIRDFSNEELLAASGSSFGGADFDQFGEFEDIAKERLEGQTAERTAMERIVGPIEQFDMYAEGFGLIGSAAVSAYEAIVTGSEGAGAAIKKTIGAGMMALGKDMFVRSLQEGAWAIADLARGNFPGAKAHGIAAGLFFAGSVAAGKVASELGAGGSTAGASGGGRGNTYAAAGISGSSGGSGGGGTGAPTYIVLGDSFGYESQRSRDQRFRSALHTAGRSGAPSQGVQHS